LLSQQERAQEQALTAKEAAGRLKVGLKKVYQLCESGELKHHRVGKSIRILPEDVDRFIRQSGESRARSASRWF
jgi:excisionase family DNA binding protein